MTIYDEEGYVQTQIPMRPFPFIKEYASNLTIEGELCYAYNLRHFQTECLFKFTNK